MREFAKSFCTALAQAAPERFTVALPKASGSVAFFLHFLCNQRTPTAIMPYSARARSGMPVATPIGWDGLRDIESAGAFTIADVEQLGNRTAHDDSWGIVSQELPASWR